MLVGHLRKFNIESSTQKCYNYSLRENMYENEKYKKVHVTFDYSWGDICIYVKDGIFLLTQQGPVPHSPGEVISQPLLQLTKEEAIDLMDGLYQQGIRPTEVGTAGQVAAMKYHLEDMRKLVFK